jgi:hypothetical protein
MIPTVPTKEETLHKVDLFLSGLSEMHPDAVSSLEGAGVIVDFFNACAAAIQAAGGLQLTGDEEHKVALFRSELVKLQVAVFPMLRKRTTSYMGRELWKADATAEAFGSRNTTIQFVAGDFAAHRNIQTAQNGVQALLMRLRFKRAQYKWIPSAEETWSYKLDSPPDNVVAKIDSAGKCYGGRRTFTGSEVMGAGVLLAEQHSVVHALPSPGQPLLCGASEASVTA